MTSTSKSTARRDANIFREDHGVYTHDTFKLTDDLSMIAGLRWQTGRSVVDQRPTKGKGMAPPGME
jgi:outer membrane receptor for monomeric catechols